MHPSYIHVIPSAVSKQTCNSLIETYNSNTSLEFTVDEPHRKYKKLDITQNELNQPAQTDLLKSLHACFLDYERSLNLDSFQLPNNHAFSSFCINKYEINSNHAYAPHVDTTNKSNSDRFLCATLFLNTVQKGGDLKFGLVKTVRPIAGTVVVYPASWMNPYERVTPESENLYSVTAYLKFL